MVTILKVGAILLSCILFLGYAWWDRDYLSFLEKTFMLSPAYGLLIIGIVPFSYLRLKKIKFTTTAIFLLGVAYSVIGIFKAMNIDIAPDKGAIFFNVITITMLCIGIYLSWRPTQKTNGVETNGTNGVRLD